MNEKRMWNIEKELREKGEEGVANRLFRDREKDNERLFSSGLPTWRQFFLSAEEFLSGKEEIKEIFNHTGKIFLAAIPKKEASGKLKRSYTFDSRNFEEAAKFVISSVGENKGQYDVKINLTDEVDIAGILILKNKRVFFELIYGNFLDKLNHGEINADLFGSYNGKEILIKYSHKINLGQLDDETFVFIKDALIQLKSKGIEEGYFEIQHPKNFNVYGRSIFLNYIQNDAYKNIPSEKKEDFDLKSVIFSNIKKIAEEETRSYVREILGSLSLSI